MARIIDREQANLTGKQILKARKLRNLSQKTLSEKLEVHGVYVCRGSLSRIEHGERTVTDIEIDALSKVLMVSLDFLFGRSDDLDDTHK